MLAALALVVFGAYDSYPPLVFSEPALQMYDLAVHWEPPLFIFIDRIAVQQRLTSFSASEVCTRCSCYINSYLVESVQVTYQNIRVVVKESGLSHPRESMDLPIPQGETIPSPKEGEGGRY